MTRLADRRLTDVIESFSAPTPTPGGGSAAALAGALGASLLAMVAAMPKSRTGTPAEREILDAVLHQLRHGRDHLLAAVDRDAAAYERVVAAYRLPKATEHEKTERAAAVQAAMRGATEVPLDVARACHAAAREGLAVARVGHRAAASDAGVAFELLRAALAGAALNVRTNLGSMHDTGFVEGVRSDLQRLEEAMTGVVEEARATLA